LASPVLNCNSNALRKEEATRHQWLTPVILATQETEIRRIMVRSQPRQIVHETLSQKNHKKWLEVKAMSSNPSIILKNKKDRKEDALNSYQSSLNSTSLIRTFLIISSFFSVLSLQKEVFVHLHSSILVSNLLRVETMSFSSLVSRQLILYLEYQGRAV
jgi:hypothetical protein